MDSCAHVRVFSFGDPMLQKRAFVSDTGTNWPPGSCVPRPWQRACCLVEEASPGDSPLPTLPSRKLTRASHTPSQARGGGKQAGLLEKAPCTFSPQPPAPRTASSHVAMPPPGGRSPPNLQAPHSPSRESVLGRGWVCACIHARPRVCGHHPGATAKVQLR